MLKLKKGFTLIELLIVIAILGTLAVVVLLALNPVQQLARTRDAGRISSVTQLGHAIEAYATSNSGVYVPETAGAWIGNLVTAGEIAAAPGAITYSVAGVAACAAGAGQVTQSSICYDASSAVGAAPAIVFARLEAQANIARCTALNATYTQAYAIYITAQGQGGIACTAGTVPTVGGALNLLP